MLQYDLPLAFGHLLVVSLPDAVAMLTLMTLLLS